MPNKKPPMTMEELVEQCEIFSTCINELETKYIITENFPMHGIRTYELFDLLGEFAIIGNKKHVIFYDKHDKLIKDNTRVLNMFIVDSDVKVERDYIDNNGQADDYYIAKIIFKDGDITIKVPINVIN
jgi:cyclopropane fatty-acyl-phospholipid synthase-like methyltransferase